MGQRYDVITRRRIPVVQTGTVAVLSPYRQRIIVRKDKSMDRFNLYCARPVMSCLLVPIIALQLI